MTHHAHNDIERENAKQWADEARAPRPSGGDRPPVTVCLADLPVEQIDWLWPKFIAVGKITIIGGMPDTGKTMLTADIAARLSAGRPWPDTPNTPNPAAGVLFLNGEDGLSDTINPRLVAAGANRAVIHAVALMGEPGQKAQRWFTLDDLPTLERAVGETPNCRLVIIDPAAAFLGEVSENSNAEVRSLLGPLADMASRLGVAIVLVTHTNKAVGQRAMHRLLGSVAWSGAARTAWIVMADPDDPDRRFLLNLKNNLSKDKSGLAYRIVNPGRLDWESGAVTITADEVLAAEASSGEERTAVEEAMDFLSERLASGAVPGLTVYEEARQAGITKKTLERAKGKLGVVSKPAAFRAPWVWQLPEPKGSGSHTSPSSPEIATPTGMAKCGADGELCAPDPEEWEERAAVLEHEQGRSREDAEAIARGELGGGNNTGKLESRTGALWHRVT